MNSHYMIRKLIKRVHDLQGQIAYNLDLIDNLVAYEKERLDGGDVRNPFKDMVTHEHL